MRYVGVGRRFVALSIDWVVSLLWVIPLSDVQRTPGVLRVSLTGWRFGAAIVLWLIYFTLMEGTIGATLGKLTMGIRVRDPQGGSIGLQPALVRNLMRVVDALPYVIPYLVGAIAVWNSSTRQRLGDRAAHTVVIRRTAVTAPVPAPAPPQIAAGDTGQAPLPPPPEPPSPAPPS